MAQDENIYPQGRIERIYLHWSGGDYETVYESYHYCVAMRDGVPVVIQTNDLRLNMRDISHAPGEPYAAHTARRNSFAAGLAVMGMRDARPNDFGAYPLTDALLDELCGVAAALARTYAIPIDAAHVLTHAEAALADGYFGADDNDTQRWDIARLRPQPHPLRERDAIDAGEELRRRIRAR